MPCGRQTLTSTPLITSSFSVTILAQGATWLRVRVAAAPSECVVAVVGICKESHKRLFASSLFQ